jgi:cell wall-associated NlpC family hydrolase
VQGHAWTYEQLTNAATIVATTAGRKVPERAAVIAVAASITEANLINVPGGDQDSLGLFQQRPSQGWGTPAEILDPVHATNAFLDHLIAIPNWQQLPLGEAAQDVERSQFPERYAPWEQAAAALVSRTWTGAATGAMPCPDPGRRSGPAQKVDLPANWASPSDPATRTAVLFALAQRGKPYVWGAKGPDSYDCSGLTAAAWAAAGVAIGAGTSAQIHAGVPAATVSAGDLVFIPGADGTPSAPGHVGLAIGADLVVDAYDVGVGVILQPLSAWSGRVVAIRHITAALP